MAVMLGARASAIIFDTVVLFFTWLSMKHVLHGSHSVSGAGISITRPGVTSPVLDKVTAIPIAVIKGSTYVLNVTLLVARIQLSPIFNAALAACYFGYVVHNNKTALFDREGIMYRLLFIINTLGIVLGLSHPGVGCLICVPPCSLS